MLNLGHETHVHPMSACMKLICAFCGSYEKSVPFPTSAQGTALSKTHIIVITWSALMTSAWAEQSPVDVVKKYSREFTTRSTKPAH